MDDSLSKAKASSMLHIGLLGNATAELDGTLFELPEQSGHIGNCDFCWLERLISIYIILYIDI